MDHARPLAPRGVATVPQVARRLAQLAPRIDLALVSDARRTRETIGLVEAIIPDIPVTLEPLIYDARPSTLLDLVQQVPAGAKSVLMVGHNPGFQALALLLADPARSEPDALYRLERKYPTAGLAVLDIEAPWAAASPGAAVLAAFITPAMLGGIDED